MNQENNEKCRLVVDENYPDKHHECATCKYWNHWNPEIMIHIVMMQKNDCRRNPPTAQYEFQGHRGSQQHTFWPQTLGVDFCGRWEKRPDVKVLTYQYDWEDQ